jgi:sigma-B regulation protein RsbU (phosphoserine phosphatase)
MSDAHVAISPQQMKGVLDLSRMLAVTTDLNALLEHICHAATQMLDCERASIFLHDPATNELWTKVATQSKEIRVPSTAGIVGQAFTNNTIVDVPDPYNDARFNPEPDRRTGFVTRNLLTTPMVGIDQNPLGAIQAVNKRGHKFEPVDTAILQLLADTAGVAIQRYNLQQAAIESVALRKEMDLAKRVQEGLIPACSPTITGLDVVGWTRAASITGGDCYDLWQLPDGRLAVFLGDASGHGIAPALIVSQVRTLIRALESVEPSPAKLLFRVNARMCDDLKDGQFITAFLGYISPDGTMEWTSAGQGPILVREGPGAPLLALDTPSYPLGFLPTWPDTPGDPVKLEPGGSILVCTDGIFESFSPTGEQFGNDRVVKLIEAADADNAVSLVDSIRAAVEKWQGKIEPHDDQTIVSVRRV